MSDAAYRHFSNVIGFDDAPFLPDYTGPVKVVGAVFARLHLNGILIGEVEKDGDDAAVRLADLILRSKFAENLHLVMLQGMALGGFNVVDIRALHECLNLPVLIVARHGPNMAAIRDALLTKVPGGAQKWARVERLGAMEQVRNIFIQRVGMTIAQVETVLDTFTVEGHIPEPLRTAHLIAGALVNGESRGRV